MAMRILAIAFAVAGAVRWLWPGAVVGFLFPGMPVSAREGAIIGALGVRGHIAYQKNDHGASYRRYGALQSRSRLKINFREIFGVVRFSSFALSRRYR